MSSIKTYSQQIIEHIKKMLLQGQLQPGDKVNEVHLASALSISRAPIREALQILTKEGLLVSIPQRGKFIKSLSPQEIQDGYYIGGVLEGAAVSATLAHFTRDDFTALAEQVEKMRTLQDTEDYAEAFTQVDMVFHDILFSHSGNKQLGEISRTVCQRMSKFLLFRYWPQCFSREEVAQRHQQVLDAVMGGDPQVVELTIREHYNQLGRRMARFGCEKPPYESGS